MNISYKILALAGLAILFAAPAQAQNASPDLTRYCRDTMGGNMTGGWSKRKKGWYCLINGRDDKFSRALVLDEACRKQFPNSTGGGSRVPGAGLDPVPFCKGTKAADKPRRGSSVAGGQSPDLGAWCRSKNPKATDAVFKGNTWHCISGRYVPGQGFGADVVAACASQFPGSRPVKSGQDSQGRTRWICKTDGKPITSSNTGVAAPTGRGSGADIKRGLAKYHKRHCKGRKVVRTPTPAEKAGWRKLGAQWCQHMDKTYAAGSKTVCQIMGAKTYCSKPEIRQNAAASCVCDALDGKMLP